MKSHFFDAEVKAKQNGQRLKSLPEEFSKGLSENCLVISV